MKMKMEMKTKTKRKMKKVKMKIFLAGAFNGKRQRTTDRRHHR